MQVVGRLRASRSRLLLCSLLCSLLSPARGHAASASAVAIRWEGPPTCARPDTLESDVAERLGPREREAQAAEIAVRVRPRSPEGFELTVSVRTDTTDEPASRTVALERCEDVQRAAAILIATALVPEEREEPAPAAEPAESDAEPAPLASGWSLRASALGDYQLLPAPRLGLGAGVQYERGRIPAWLEARYLFRARTEAAPTRQVVVEIEHVGAALGSAYLWRAGRVRFGPQIEAEFGGLRARGAVENRVGPARWAFVMALWGGALLDVTVASRVALYASTSAGWIVAPPTFADDRVVGYRVERFSARAALGLRIVVGPKKTGGSGQ